ncbi:TIGR03915 family putative DNA repair protein [Caenimonas terrae]|uniref:TIGR03915 family putative DNA repair protein n=1 Tax=Caenimonas terrae TaxID=696074 RepID=A0ABW0N9C6_9BURK
MEARLASETDLAGFREEARSLLAHQVPPDQVDWRTADNADQFAEVVPADARGSKHVPRAAMAIVPASFLRLCEIVVLHRDPDRFALLYRLLWRLVHEPGLRSDPIDPDMLAAQQMGQAVRRDLHKMKAFLRFKPLEDNNGDSPLHLGWFEPSHHILEAAAPWFVRRFAQQRWAILTPERSVRWTPASERLEFGPGVAGAPAHVPHPDDAFLLAGYSGIFGGRDST